MARAARTVLSILDVVGMTGVGDCLGNVRVPRLQRRAVEGRGRANAGPRLPAHMPDRAH